MLRHRVRRLLIALIVLALTAWCVVRHASALPRFLAFDLELGPSSPKHGEPIISTGRQGAGDLLFARYIDEHTVVFGYDSWGEPVILGQTPVAVRPQEPLHLRVEMPSLRWRHDYPGRVWVECNHQVVLDAPASFHVADDNAVFIGANAIGSSWSAQTVSHPLELKNAPQTRPRDWFGALPRWLIEEPLQLAVVLLLAVGLVWTESRLTRFEQRHPGAWLLPLLARHRWCLVAVLLCSVGFAGVITYGTYHLTTFQDLGVFYDYQALSLLHGRLDVLDQGIRGEAFVVGGKLYGYFGPVPALMRMPLLILGAPVGRLTQLLMLGSVIATLVAAYRILCDTKAWLAPHAGLPSPWATLVVLGNVGFGSTVYFLGGRPMMFHEAILSGLTFALWSTRFSLRQLQSPARRWWLGALAFGLLSVHSRPPTGLFALTTLGLVALYQLVHGINPSGPRNATLRSARWKALGVGLAAALAVLSFNGLSYLKFRTFDGSPLRYNRAFSPERLAHIEGKNFHRANIPFGVYSYLIRRYCHVEAHFPYLFMGSTAGREFPAAKIDLPDHTLAMPYAMPGLTLLAVGGTALALFRTRAARPAVAILWLAAVPMSLAMFAAIAIAHRYTGDFCPFLIATAAVGAAIFDTSLGRVARISRWLLSLATLAAIAVTVALTFDYQSRWGPGVPDAVKQRYQAFAGRVDALVQREPKRK